jgi:hypothetical protein
MRSEVLTVLIKRDGWFVDHDGPRQGPYQDQDFALQVAVVEAMSLARQGARPKLAVQDNSGVVKAEMCL